MANDAADVTLQTRAAETHLREAVVMLCDITKIYDPSPRWMRFLARTAIPKRVLALDGVNLTLRKSEICAVVGPNGAGKTTLFRTIVGLTTPTQGRGTVFGFDIDKEAEDVRQIVGWMPAEDRSLLMRATCKENLALHGRLQGMSAPTMRTRIAEVLDVVGIADKRDSVVATLSSGMKARLKLARALLPRPKVLLLDEPTAAIDPVAAHSLLRLVTDLVDSERLAVLISSHRLEEIEALRSNVVLLGQGRIRYAGDLDELRHEWSEKVVELEFDNPAAAFEAADTLTANGAEADVQAPTVVRCLVPEREGLGPLLAALLPQLPSLRSVREMPLPLRDLIAHIYSSSSPARDKH